MDCKARIIRSSAGQAMPDRSVPLAKDAFDKKDGTCLYWLGNAGVYINARGTGLLMDPVLEAQDEKLLFPLPARAEDFPADLTVLITHCDGDHFCRNTCKALSGTFHTTRYVAHLMEGDGINGTGHGINESFAAGGARVTLTPVDHSWQNSFPAYNYRVWEKDECCGFFVETQDGSVWMPGDSKLIEEQLRLAKAPDVILLDFSDDPFHITLDGAVTLANAYPRARLVCVHWGTYDAPDSLPFNADPSPLFDRVTNPERIVILRPGEEYRI